MKHNVNAFYGRLFNQNALYLRESLNDMIKAFQKKKNQEMLKMNN